ncbi:mesoderm posterior ab [Garra rufa]|uniref:mesoderm posterior ab n=1 Tax=Garra rufa TaxID=137080 RepID=UPI003CCEA403
MEFNFSPYMLQGAKCQFEYGRSSTTIDAGYFSACGSLSPSSSIDSGCFSPPASSWGTRRPTGTPDIDCAPAKKTRTALPDDGKKRSRSKNPGTKRQTASEREKLRMRDLTKALNHLRTYLPASVAPAGQTLTKIETLRLTISYISYLSAQLEQPEETFNHETTPRCCSQDTSDRLQNGLLSETWCLGEPQELVQDNVQHCPTFTTFGDSPQQMENSFPSTSNFRDAQSYMFPCTTTHNATYSHQFFQ